MRLSKGRIFSEPVQNMEDFFLLSDSLQMSVYLEKHGQNTVIMAHAVALFQPVARCPTEIRFIMQSARRSREIFLDFFHENDFP